MIGKLLSEFGTVPMNSQENCCHHWGINISACNGDDLIEDKLCSSCGIHLNDHIQLTCEKLGIEYKFHEPVFDVRKAPGA